MVWPLTHYRHLPSVPEDQLVSITCQSSEKGAAVRPEIDPQKTGTIPVGFQVDKREFLIKAETDYGEMAGFGLPTFRMSPCDPLLNALARGRLARILVGRKRVKIHLKGAAKAIQTMRRACG